ncbi:hypothetical protein [Streptomyces sp. NPDC058247]|uniref:hypothetical protein n=1 Tax=Streptomyces sp. NPDC058247 TaxID=3346401 RepID=UPI0036E84CD8
MLSGVSHTDRRSVGHTQRGTPELRDIREECWQRARATVGDQEFDTAFDRGTVEIPASFLTLAVAGRLPHEE